jgi:hypothetical protein
MSLAHGYVEFSTLKPPFFTPDVDFFSPQLSTPCVSMMEDHRYSAEELKHCRDTAEKLLLGSLRTDVSIELDWEIPACAADPIIFLANISRSNRKSSIRFGIDLKRLQTVQLEKLRAFLTHCHAGTLGHYNLVLNLAWLLQISLTQTAPQLSPAERQLKVRQLLLSPP